MTRGLSISQLEINNFGRFRGNHVFDFETERGVWIVYGSNGLGKTSLHNAFRFVMYGEIRGRAGTVDPSRLVNREAASRGDTLMFVQLNCELDDAPFSIHRSFDTSRTPRNHLVVEQDGSVLSQHDSDVAVRSLFVPSLSQFFLLDAEDLKPYESLLDETGGESKLRRDIEQLLGIPILKASGDSVREVHRWAERRISSAAAANEQTKLIGSTLATAEAVRDEIRESLQKDQGALNGAYRRLEEADRLLQENARLAEVYQRRASRKEAMREAKTSHTEAKSALSDSLESLWLVLADAVARSHELEIGSELATIAERLGEAHSHQRAATILRDSTLCPTCGTALSDHHRHGLLLDLEASIDPGEISVLEQRAVSLKAHAQTIRILRDTSDRSATIEREKALNTAALKVDEIEQDLVEIEETIGGSGDIGLDDALARRDEAKEIIGSIERRLEETRADLADQEQAVENLKDDLAKHGFVPERRISEVEHLSEQLHHLFMRATERYVQELMTSVERRATEVFTSISAESEYIGLSINDSFGLSIIDSEDRTVEGRSAGYEHLVALSLIAALQDNAPVRGPLIMDNPFLRLDETHTEKVIAALPQVADQVVLLTFPGEFDRETAIRGLGTSLVSEFQLKRAGVEQTEIEEGGL